MNISIFTNTQSELNHPTSISKKLSKIFFQWILKYFMYPYTEGIEIHVTWNDIHSIVIPLLFLFFIFLYPRANGISDWVWMMNEMLSHTPKIPSSVHVMQVYPFKSSCFIQFFSPLQSVNQSWDFFLDSSKIKSSLHLQKFKHIVRYDAYTKKLMQRMFNGWSIDTYNCKLYAE